MTRSNICPSRRSVLVGAAIAAGTASRADAQPSFKQEDAMYQMMPKDNQRCGLCNSFVAPSSCMLVQGTITPNSWCQFFSVKE